MEILLELEHIRLEKDDRLAWVTFTRERYLNAMSNAASSQVHRVVMALREEPDVRVAVVRGLGRAFSTGLDLKEYSSEQIGMDYYERWEHILRTLETMEKIVIAGMHGYCLGGSAATGSCPRYPRQHARFPDRPAGDRGIPDSRSEPVAAPGLCQLRAGPAVGFEGKEHPR